jgi:hypothetical protein
LYGAFVWACKALKHQKRWFPARAVDRGGMETMQLTYTRSEVKESALSRLGKAMYG